MSKNTQPIFVAAPVIGMAQVLTANALLDGTGTLATVVTAGADGTRIEYIRVKAIVTTTAGMIRLFLHDGTNARLWHELPVSAVTPSGTVESFEVELTPTKPLDLPSGWSLRASTQNAETFNVFAHGGSY